MKLIRSILKNVLPYGISNFVIRRNEIQCEIPSSEEPAVFNAQGQKLKTFFLNDDRARNWPYGFVDGRYPQYIFWDRNNYGLKNHIYSHEKILDVKGKPIKKFAFFIEGESIDPESYKLFDYHSGLEQDFDLIFTYSARFLDKYKNAVFIPSGGVYYGISKHGGRLNSEQYKAKTKNISLVSSEKTRCELHKFRLDLARYYKQNSMVDTYGTFDGGNHIKIADSLEYYRYSVIVENDIVPYRFTEKILNCFASMTVPIYIGATKIGDFFNKDGIIQVSVLQTEAIDKIIASCNEEDYIARLPAIRDNFNRIMNYLCVEDYIYTHYKEYFI
jgi:hypothetical protein